jgi:hypothetical protein
MRIRTEVRAGQCPGKWYYGTVQESSGGGYYGSVFGEDGLTHYFNNGYTKFCPYRQGVQVGQWVMYSPFEPPNERAGKVACITPAPM